MWVCGVMVTVGQSGKSPTEGLQRHDGKW